MPPVNILSCRDVCFSYGIEDVLHDVNVVIQRGEYIGIVGPNGGGKTTLIKIFLGLLKPMCGFVQIFDQDISAFKDWPKIGYVPQKATNFDPNFPATVREVVLMGRYARRGLLRRVTAEDEGKAQDALSKVDMGAFSSRLIGDLSAGQQQRVFIARALASEPEVLILDEPTAGVDESTQKEFYALLRRLNTQHGITLILISHDLDVVGKQASRIIYVNRTVTDNHIHAHA
ncbi:MAG: metal ABC transporter ATP-binding protein [Candidatus Andersenbacteria bacterium]|nr:metal ABC transporter ATP-binding protein [Candidatus Andersenbacteria bacterium]